MLALVVGLKIVSHIHERSGAAVVDITSGHKVISEKKKIFFFDNIFE
jgi:hypothetical protein